MRTTGGSSRGGHPDAWLEEELALSPAQRDFKQRMFACYRTQSYVLKNFSIRAERFRRAPRYDFSRPPHPGTLFYERCGAIITGASWLALLAGLSPSGGA